MKFDHQPHEGEQQGGMPATSGQSLGRSDGCRVFAWLWTKLATVLGTPATAALMRRAISAVAAVNPDLRGIAISRERLTYSYHLPTELCTDPENQAPAYRALFREVLRLTGELTGGVMVRGLIQSDELSPWLPDREEVDKWLNPER